MAVATWRKGRAPTRSTAATRTRWRGCIPSPTTPTSCLTRRRTRTPSLAQCQSAPAPRSSPPSSPAPALIQRQSLRSTSKGGGTTRRAHTTFRSRACSRAAAPRVTRRSASEMNGRSEARKRAGLEPTCTATASSSSTARPSRRRPSSRPRSSSITRGANRKWCWSTSSSRSARS